jgi:hypothetical protein
MAGNMPSASMVCGDFSTMTIGFFRPGLELSTNPYGAGFQTGAITVLATLSVDVGIPFASSFCKSTSIT